jgi:hypothetical protein
LASNHRVLHTLPVVVAVEPQRTEPVVLVESVAVVPVQHIKATLSQEPQTPVAVAVAVACTKTTALWPAAAAVRV